MRDLFHFIFFAALIFSCHGAGVHILTPKQSNRIPERKFPQSKLMDKVIWMFHKDCLTRFEKETKSEHSGDIWVAGKALNADA